MTPAQSPRSDGLWVKILYFPLTRILVAALAVLIAVGIVQAVVVGAGSAFALKANPFTAILYYALFLVLTVLAATQSYRFYVRRLEKRSVIELGLDGAWREGGTGALFGIALIAATLAILGLLGVYHFSGIAAGIAGPVSIVAALANDISGAFVEEILLRAIVFRIAEEVAGSWWAIFFSILLFTALHLVEGQGTALSAALIGVEATLLLCGAWMLTRRLWLAVGIHAGWDFAQGALFGVGATGQEHIQGVLQGQLTGSPLLTGGAAGIEASIVAFVVTLAAGIYLIVRANRRASIMPPAWRRSNAGERSEGVA
jgi:membrane protease YdiL (CAAX protease family)